MLHFRCTTLEIQKQSTLHADQSALFDSRGGSGASPVHRPPCHATDHRVAPSNWPAAHPLAQGDPRLRLQSTSIRPRPGMLQARQGLLDTFLPASCPVC